jgi:hypothetical protein
MKTITIWEVEPPEEIENNLPELLREACRGWLDMVAKSETDNGRMYHEDTVEHHIVSAALKAMYGEDVWEYYNERVS